MDKRKMKTSLATMDMKRLVTVSLMVLLLLMTACERGEGANRYLCFLGDEVPPLADCSSRGEPKLLTKTLDNTMGKELSFFREKLGTPADVLTVGTNNVYVWRKGARHPDIAEFCKLRIEFLDSEKAEIADAWVRIGYGRGQWLAKDCLPYARLLNAK